MLNYRILLVVFVCFFCGNCTNSNKKDINSDEAISLFQNTISKKGAAISVRVIYEGRYCQTTTIRLRQIVGDRLDQKNYTNVYSGNNDYTIAGLSDKAISQTKWVFGKSDAWFLGKVTFETITDKLTNREIAKAFSPIAPGDYILTGLDCNIDANARVSMGESEHDTFIVDLLSPEKIPVAGANYIHIDKNELVDAGILDITHQTSHNFLFGSNSGTAEGSLTSARFQDYLNSHFADLAKKIKFTSFEVEKSLASAPQENTEKK